MNAGFQSFQCLTCSKTFRQRKHLQRHCSIHSTERQFRCDFCDARFKRRDILYKHLKTCYIRLERHGAMPEGGAPGKPVKSCRNCALSKKACNQEWPCSTCASRGQVCTYRRTENSLPSATDLNLNYLIQPIDGTFLALTDASLSEWWTSENNQQLSFPQLETGLHSAGMVSSPRRLQNGSPFEFLLHFTRSSGLHRVFNYSRRRRCITGSVAVPDTSDTLPLAWEQEAFPDITSSSWLRLDPEDWSQSASTAPSMSSYCKSSDSSSYGPETMVRWLDDPLFTRTTELWTMFRARLPQLLRRKPELLTSESELDAHCLEFLSPPNLRKFADLFFDQWYPHCPILHRPTFHLSTAPALLLAPVILLGACMSDLEEDSNNGKLYADIAEELVFSSPLLSLYPTEAAEDTANISAAKILQAGYFICLLQNWEGDDTAKKRVRHQRAAALVTAARDLGFSSANNTLLSDGAFSWIDFIHREETIRSFTYIFLLDSAFLIFNNTPPKLMLQELEMKLTCPEEAFRAQNAEACCRVLQKPENHCESSLLNLTLRGALETIACPTIDALLLEGFSHMSVQNLFAIISGIHIALFQQRMLLLCPQNDLNPIRLAIERWRVAWGTRHNESINAVPCEAWEETGFIGHAHEYASLALAHLENMEAKWTSGPSFRAVVQPDVRSERLDDTSMGLVTNLMLGLAIT